MLSACILVKEQTERERGRNKISESGERSLRKSNCALLSTRSAMIYGRRVCVMVLGVGSAKLCQLHNNSVVLIWVSEWVSGRVSDIWVSYTVLERIALRKTFQPSRYVTRRTANCTVSRFIVHIPHQTLLGRWIYRRWDELDMWHVWGRSDIHK